jgi:membrane protein YqaA with SNARE-associated domain
MSFLTRLSHWLVATLEPYGAPGLMLIAIFDSSFISLPEVNDAALMALSVANPSNMWKLATFTVIGSIIGCTLLYTVGRKGGEALLTKRFAATKVARVRAWYDKYGMLAIIVPSLLPPPLPFKIFVLCAGAFRISWLKFMLAVGIGRSIRYFTEGYLAVRYGSQAMQMVKDNAGPVGLALAAIIVVGTLVVVYSRRRRAATTPLLLPLLLTLAVSGCVRTTVIPENQRIKPSTPFTRAQALERLLEFSEAVETVETPFGLEGSSPELNDKNKRTSFSGFGGILIVQRPGRINLYGGLVGQGFEMRSNGTDYEVHISLNKQVHTGKEDGPPAKSQCKIGERSNQFVDMRPREILEALVPDFRPLLDGASIAVPARTLTVPQDQRRYFIVDFMDVSSVREPRFLQTVWFDLSTPDVDIVRRQIYDRNGDVERDTRYSNHTKLGKDSVRYPTRFQIHFVPTDTNLTISTDPKAIRVNTDVDPEAFELGTHKGAEVCRLEPAAAVAGQ